MKRVVCYPFDSKKNKYLEINKGIWEELGFDVIPYSDLNLRLFFDRKNTVTVVNWLEDSIVSRGKGTVKANRFIKKIILLAFFRILSKKLIWVRHNYKPHNLKKENSMFSFSVFCKIFSFFSDEKITHSYFDEGWRVIDHPLYPALNDSRLKEKRDFFIFGLVKEYKGIDVLLEYWPKDISLTIAGLCVDSKLENKIENIIIERELDVVWDNKFIEDDELEVYLKSSKVVVLPHNDKSMIVSGAFYHAASNGCSILMKKTPFFDYIKSWFSNAESFEYEGLEEACNKVLAKHNRSDVENSISKRCSKSVLLSPWSEAFK